MGNKCIHRHVHTLHCVVVMCARWLPLCSLSAASAVLSLRVKHMISPGLDGWLSLRQVEPDEEVQGDVHLSLELQTTGQRPLLRCDVIEARSVVFPPGGTLNHAHNGPTVQTLHLFDSI